MRTLGRVGIALAMALAWPAAGLRAQEPASPQNTPPPDTVGPRELQNFSLEGNRTQPAQEPATQEPTASPPSAATAARSVRPATAANERPAATSRRNTPQATPPEPLRQTAPASSITVALPGIDRSADAASAPAGSPAPAPAIARRPETSLAPQKGAVVPWLAAGMALFGGLALLLWRRRSREVLATEPHIDLFEAPVPELPLTPARPSTEPAAPEPAAPLRGLVSVRLRPWLDMGFRPLRCILENERVTFEFEVELFNSGSAPARATLLEANLFNAGANQDQEIGGFFASPALEGDRMAAIAPGERTSVLTQLAVPLNKVQVLDAGGSRFFVPLIAFNASYRWAGGVGQTSAAYLLGREGRGEKMAPFRLDLGPRVFRSVEARILPLNVRS